MRTNNMNRNMLKSVSALALGAVMTVTFATVPVQANYLKNLQNKGTEINNNNNVDLNNAGKSIDSCLISNIRFDNIGINERFFRIDSGLKFDNTVFCFKGKITVEIPKRQGKRLFCHVQPIFSGTTSHDQKDTRPAIFAFEPTSNNYVADISFTIPATWCGIDNRTYYSNPKPIRIDFSIVDHSLNDSLLCTIAVKTDRKSIIHEISCSPLFQERNNLICSDPIYIDLDPYESCPICDGTGVCRKCDGQGYLDPSLCRKCSSNPGFCIHCNGEGKVFNDSNSIW